ncbi:MAG: tRNA guanosine(34) transglycosylase Tgt [Candidatus Dojkabacteria bacterium]
MVKELIKTQHGDILLPAFMPDATYGSIKSISFKDAETAGVKEIVTTTMHIEQNIGSEFIKEFGGIHKFFGWDRPILTDSGGWQVFSLINRQRSVISNQSSDKKQRSENSKLMTDNFITEAGCSFLDPVTNQQFLLTPESSMQIQFNLGADLMTVLDDPILGDASFAERKECVRINTVWAKRAKKKFDELSTPSSLRDTSPLIKGRMRGVQPLLGCVIQGGNDYELRKQSAEELVELDFDIYNFGGLPLHTPVTWKTESEEGFFHDMLKYVSDLIPDKKCKYAMGVGQPTDIAYCVDVGWNLFDTVLPTRNARHGYLYVSEGQGEETKIYKKLSHDVLRIKKEIYSKDSRPIDENCKCEACVNYSRAYIRHLIRMNEPAGFRLATIHNLTFYTSWMQDIRISIK